MMKLVCECSIYLSISLALTNILNKLSQTLIYLSNGYMQFKTDQEMQ